MRGTDVLVTSRSAIRLSAICRARTRVSRVGQGAQPPRREVGSRPCVNPKGAYKVRRWRKGRARIECTRAVTPHGRAVVNLPHVNTSATRRAGLSTVETGGKFVWQASTQRGAHWAQQRRGRARYERGRAITPFRRAVRHLPYVNTSVTRWSGYSTVETGGLLIERLQPRRGAHRERRLRGA